MTTLEAARTLEEKNRAVSNDTIREPLIPYALAQLRLRIRPALTPGWLHDDPVHIVLLGGTNSGKSTLVNILLGRPAAGMNVTARFSQHPEAYRPRRLGDAWLDAFPSRFVGYARFHNEHPPRQSNEELLRGGYRPAFAVLDPDRLPVKALAPLVTPTAVLWDVPDFSTEEALVYFGTVLDVLALADMVIMVVTDESYADERGRVLFRLVQATGVSLHVVANKLIPSPALLTDIKAAYTHEGGDGQAQGATLPLVSFHHLPWVEGETPEARLRNVLGTPEAASLREAIAREAACGPELKRRTLMGAVRLLERRREAAFRPLVTEGEMIARWEQTVKRIAHEELLERYRRDYVNSQRYGEFNQALVHLMELLEVPGVGPVMKLLRGVIRTPFRLVTGLLSRVFFSAEAASRTQPPEHDVLVQLFETWLAALKSEAQTQASSRIHAGWADVVRGLETPEFRNRLVQTFETAYRAYRQDIDVELQRRSREIYTTIEQNPTLLNTLRGANVAVDAATLFLIVKSGGIDWSDAVIGPLVAGLRRVLLDAGMEAYLEQQKQTLQKQQFAMMQRVVSEHLVHPVSALFGRGIQAGEVEQARQDFRLVAQAALHVAQGAGE